MKKYIFWSMIFVFLLSGCSDILDIKPTNMISEEDVKKDPALVNAFLTKIYANTRWQTGAPTENMGTIGVCGGEHNVFAAWQTPYAAAMHVMNENGAHNILEYWPYENIRSANEIIETLKEAKFDAAQVAQKTAEARFLRAFMYFEMVKRYGGVPIITVPQSIDQPTEELYVPRNSEKEVYDFIAKEMDEIVSVLSSTYGTTDYGRATKWAAYALKSRAMLYAASIAQYGTVQLNGLLGIPKSEAAAYYTKAYDASMEIIKNSPHALYKGSTDPVKNYGEIFTKDGNSEIILAEVYNLSLLKVHSWNHYCMPEGFNAGWGSNYPVYWEFAEKYEYTDGSSGKVDPAKLDGKTLNDINDLMHKKDPRFRASVFYPESPWQGKVVHFHNSTVGFDPAGTWPQTGQNRNRQKGLLVRKRVDEAKILPIFGSDETDWIVFRTGEMYLNAAEAALHLDNEPEARRLINLIRERAGMPAKTLVTFAMVQNERAVELAFEEHRYWDLRRWRIAAAELNGKGFRSPQWIYNYTQKKYTVTLKTGEYGNNRSFTERNYYFPIGLNRLADNPSLVENPGYIK